MKPHVGGDGVPRCSENECPSYDGKRCELIGCRPSLICEPAVIDMADRLRTPPATGAAMREAFECLRVAAERVVLDYYNPPHGDWPMEPSIEFLRTTLGSAAALPAPEVPDHWTATKDAMPEKSRGFLAFCQGFKEHSGVTWRRTGFAFMAWHPPGWSEQHMKDARKQLDADSLEVTHWMYLTEPKEIV